MCPESAHEIDSYNPTEFDASEGSELPRSERKRGAATDSGTKEIGERLARIRKERGITQKEMADRLGLTQPLISNYERGDLRIHGELIVKFARVLGVSTDELLGLRQGDAPRSPRDRRVLRRLPAIDRLSKRDREALLRTIDAFLTKARPETQGARGSA